MGVHAFAVGMELSTQIVQDWCFSPLISRAWYLAVEQKLVEYSAVRCAEVLAVGHALRFHVVLCLRRVDEVARDVQIASQDDILAHLGEVPYPRVQHVKEPIPEVVT